MSTFINTFLCFVFLFLQCSAVAGNKHDVTVKGGRVGFYGQIVSAACEIGLDSSDQIVQLGDVNKVMFKAIGDLSKPISFNIHMSNCTTASGTLKVMFQGVQDKDDPSSFSVANEPNCAIGVALQIFDSVGDLIYPNTYQFKSENFHFGENTLSYFVRYRSTQEHVTPGDASLQVRFKVVYQ